MVGKNLLVFLVVFISLQGACAEDLGRISRLDRAFIDEIVASQFGWVPISPSNCIIQLANCIENAEGNLIRCMNPDPVIGQDPNCEGRISSLSVRCSTTYFNDLDQCESDYHECRSQSVGPRAVPHGQRDDGGHPIQYSDGDNQTAQKLDLALFGLDDGPSNLLECLNDAEEDLKNCNTGCLDPDLENSCFSDRDCLAGCSDDYGDALDRCEQQFDE